MGRLGRPCQICTHPDRESIERAILDGLASDRAIARKYGLGKSAVGTHRPHIAQLVSQAESLRASGVLTRCMESLDEADSLSKRAAEAALGDSDRAGYRYVAGLSKSLQDGAVARAKIGGVLQEGEGNRGVQAIIMMPGPAIPAGGGRADLSLPPAEERVEALGVEGRGMESLGVATSVPPVAPPASPSEVILEGDPDPDDPPTDPQAHPPQDASTKG